MKDIIGTTIEVGDKVIFCHHRTRESVELLTGYITRVNNKMVRIDDKYNKNSYQLVVVEKRLNGSEQE